MRPRIRPLLLLAALAAASALWLPLIHYLYPPRPRAFLEAQRMRWQQPLSAKDLATLRPTNPEWDLLSRTFAALGLADEAAGPASGGAREALAALDRLTRRALEQERKNGFTTFLLPYGRRGGWKQQPPSSHFVDGELALMLGLRRLISDDDPALRRAFRQRVAKLQRRMEASPTLSAESYPDECWTFCNTVALVALRLAEHLDGSDLGGLPERWVALARRRLVDPRTGLLVSSYTLAGQHREGPEGSSIWLSATMLALIDPSFARDQYRRARQQLGRTVLGFGYAREWPVGARRRRDVDSGLLVPGLEASPSSSAFALLAAQTFEDRCFSHALQSTLELAAYPEVDARGARRYQASNLVGDAVLFAALAHGPTWRRLAATPALAKGRR